jgi:hypothetical protein
MRDPPGSSRVRPFISRTFRLATIMTFVSLATFGALVTTYKLLF